MVGVRDCNSKNQPQGGAERLTEGFAQAGSDLRSCLSQRGGSQGILLLGALHIRAGSGTQECGGRLTDTVFAVCSPLFLLQAICDREQDREPLRAIGFGSCCKMGWGVGCVRVLEI